MDEPILIKKKKLRESLTNKRLILYNIISYYVFYYQYPLSSIKRLLT